jgi:hypothetical protein
MVTTKEQKMNQSKRQIRAIRKAKTQRLQRMHAKRGNARTVTRSKYVHDDFR